MPKLIPLLRLAGATVLSLLALAALVLPASSLAAPPEGALPNLVVTPSPAIFPITTVGYQSQAQQFDIVNEGEAEAGIEKVSIEGADAAAFNFGGTDCGPLQPNQHCSAWVSFVPGGPGEKQATLSFQLHEAPEQSVALSGLAALPQLAFTPAGHDFGIQQIDRGQSTQFQLANSGEAQLQLNNIEIVGGSGAFGTGSSDCWGRWLQPGDTCSIEVWFGPHDTVAYEAELRANVNGYSFSAALKGRGGRAVVAAAENPAAFGAETAGAVGAIHTIVLSNSGDLPASFFIGVIAGGDAGSFRLLDESCTSAPVMPAGSCSAHIRFIPQSAGPKLARLAFFGDSEGGTMVELSGEGIAPAVTLLPGGYGFGDVAVGGRSAGHSFAVRNDGSTPLEVHAAAIVGADLDQFLLAGDECTGKELSAGAECLLRVRFAPDSTGTQTATLRVVTDAGPLTATLTGRGDPIVSARTASHRLHRRFRRGRSIGGFRHRVGLVRARTAFPRG